MKYDRYFKNTLGTAVETAQEDCEIIENARKSVRAAYDFIKDRYQTSQAGIGHEMEAVLVHIAEALKYMSNAKEDANTRLERVNTEQGVLEELDVDKKTADKLIKSGLFYLDERALEKTKKTLEKTGD